MCRDDSGFSCGLVWDGGLCRRIPRPPTRGAARAQRLARGWLEEDAFAGSGAVRRLSAVTRAAARVAASTLVRIGVWWPSGARITMRRHGSDSPCWTTKPKPLRRRARTRGAGRATLDVSARGRSLDGAEVRASGVRAFDAVVPGCNRLRIRRVWTTSVARRARPGGPGTRGARSRSPVRRSRWPLASEWGWRWRRYRCGGHAGGGRDRRPHRDREAGGYVGGLILGRDLMVTGFNLESVVVAFIGAVVLIAVSRMFIRAVDSVSVSQEEQRCSLLHPADWATRGPWPGACPKL
jgi:hypothetical protein